MTQDESDGRDIDTLVQQLHSESVPEAVESDMLVNTGRLYQKRDFAIENVRRKGREDGTLLPDIDSRSDASRTDSILSSPPIKDCFRFIKFGFNSPKYGTES